MDWAGWEPLADSFEDGKEILGSIKVQNFWSR
jgi:hypothetical protein